MTVVLENNDSDTLLTYINTLRQDLIEVGLDHGLTSRETIQLSQKLDYYLNQYQQIIYNK
ncbi:Spo0E family sporulation regulatory protein-aspartic acid phosphatase [Niallia sp. 01092]|uniref:Spo0E family sporulation regulatory protein-aspartic acid phosphatase n=1 Tax=unclassified Niallia TaxID=2837522 RepID=UPI003FD490FF